MKEGSADYRYFPDPDLPKLQIRELPEFSVENLEKSMPELPWKRRERYKRDFEIKDEDIEMLVRNSYLSELFEFVVSKLKNDKKLIKIASNYITSDIAGLVKSDVDSDDKLHKNISAESFAKLISMIHKNDISSRGAKNILSEMYENGGDPNKIAEEKNLFQKSDEEELKQIIEKIIMDNKKVAEDFKNGKEVSLQFLIGQGMKATQGSANPEILKKLFIEILK
jgi:aspartyl-tRNA(Asn)/glutamyl-tRNA(Gln) amidotransferase subunit B